MKKQPEGAIPEPSFSLEQSEPTDQKILDQSSGVLVDLVQTLGFANNLSEALESHSANQVYWESMAAEVTRVAQEFEAVGYAKWVAHARHYAKLALKGMGEERLLLDDIKDTVIRIYSKDATEEQRETYARHAFHAHLCQTRGGVREAERLKGTSQFSAMYATFRGLMFAYLASSQPWYYEVVTGALYNLRENSEKLKAVARAFDKRSYSLKEFVDLERAKMGNVGPLSVQEVVEEVVKRAEQRMGVDERSLMEQVSSSRRK